MPGYVIGFKSFVPFAKMSFERNAAAGTRNPGRRIRNNPIKFDTCNLCGICVKTCKRGSVKIVDKKIVIDRTCSHCGKCNDSCQTYTYAEKVVDMRALKKKM